MGCPGGGCGGGSAPRILQSSSARLASRGAGGLRWCRGRREGTGGLSGMLPHRGKARQGAWCALQEPWVGGIWACGCWGDVWEVCWEEQGAPRDPNAALGPGWQRGLTPRGRGCHGTAQPPCSILGQEGWSIPHPPNLGILCSDRKDQKAPGGCYGNSHKLDQYLAQGAAACVQLLREQVGVRAAAVRGPSCATPGSRGRAPPSSYPRKRGTTASPGWLAETLSQQLFTQSPPPQHTPHPGQRDPQLVLPSCGVAPRPSPPPPPPLLPSAPAGTEGSFIKRRSRWFSGQETTLKINK